MADEKLTQLTETTDIALTDIIYVVKDPGTVPLSKKMEYGNLAASATFPGVVELATTTEAQETTDATRVITPATLGAAIAYNPGGVLIEKATISAQATYTFSAIPQTYSNLLLRGWGLYMTSDAGDLYVQVNATAAGHYWGYWGVTIGTGAIQASASSTDFWNIANLSTDGDHSSFEITMYNYTSTARKNYLGMSANGTANRIISVGGIWLATPNVAITSLKILLSNADTFSGTLALYGFD